LIEASFSQEEAKISATKSKLNVITISLIAWAVTMSLAILVMIALVFTKLRSHTGDPFTWAAPASYVSDSSSVYSKKSSASDFTPSKFIDLNFGDNKAEKTGEGRTVEISMEDSDVEVERIEALFDEALDENEDPKAAEEARYDSVRQTERPNFRNVLTNRKLTGGSINRGMFFPDQGSSTY
jgi:hypothetical protein